MSGDQRKNQVIHESETSWEGQGHGKVLKIRCNFYTA